MFKRIMLVGACALMISGCAVWNAVVAGQSARQAAPQTIEGAEKVLALTHLTYNGLSQAILAATQQHVIHGTTASLVKEYYDRAGDALNLADKADQAADVQGITSQVQTATSLITQASAIINPPKH